MNVLRITPVLLAVVLAGCLDRELPTDLVVDPPSLQIVPIANFTQVASRLHVCGLQSDGTVMCWGANSHGQTDVPVGLSGVTQVSVGAFHTCVLKAGGTVECWGNHVATSGQPDLTDVIQVSAGGNRVCALRSDRTVVCWGATGNPPPGLSDVTQISVARDHACALKPDGTIACWGSGEAATPPADLSDVTQVSVGDLHACAVRSDGTVVCWGQERGDDRDPPDDLTDIKQVSASYDSSIFRLLACALRNDGTVRCWGGAPSLPPDLTDVTQVSTGRGVCVLRSTGAILCFGVDGPPVLRVDPTATFVATPASVVAGKPFTLSLEGATVPGYSGPVTFTYAFDCGDGAGYGPFASNASASCPTSVIGTRTVKGTVRDSDGDTQEYTDNVEVTPFYAFGGFLAPVRGDVLNQTRAGRAVPIKFSLGGDHGMDILGEVPTSAGLACDQSTVTGEVTETTTAGKSGLSYDPQTQIYSYVWKTEKPWAGSCRRLSLQLADGQVWTADFAFLK